MVPRHWKVCRKTFFKLDRHQKPSKLANNGRYKNGPAHRHPKGSKRSLLKLQTVVTKTVPLAVRRHLKVRFYVFSKPSRPIETRQKTVPLLVPKFKTVVTKSRSSQKVGRHKKSIVNIQSRSLSIDRRQQQKLRSKLQTVSTTSSLINNVVQNYLVESTIVVQNTYFISIVLTTKQLKCENGIVLKFTFKNNVKSKRKYKTQNYLHKICEESKQRCQ